MQLQENMEVTQIKWSKRVKEINVKNHKIHTKTEWWILGVSYLSNIAITLKMPPFCQAIFSMVSPKIWVWSIPKDEMPHTHGLLCVGVCGGGGQLVFSFSPSLDITRNTIIPVKDNNKKYDRQHSFIRLSWRAAFSIVQMLILFSKFHQFIFWSTTVLPQSMLPLLNIE